MSAPSSTETDIAARAPLVARTLGFVAGIFSACGKNPRLCPHLHLPLQSGCDATLRRMARHTRQAPFRELVDAARAAIPDVCITTDLIVGFPGETDEEFETSAAFVESLDFAGMHVFRYSKRPGHGSGADARSCPRSRRRKRAAPA